MKFSNPFISALAPILAFLSPLYSYAVVSTYESAWVLRNEIEALPSFDSSESGFENSRVIKLPVSRGFDQSGTSLCWAFGYLNALETLARVKNPNSKLELSRGAMQYFTLNDRFTLKINKVETYITERGTAKDADFLVKYRGIVGAIEYIHPLTSQSYDEMDQEIFSHPEPTKQMVSLKRELLRLFGKAVPSITRMLDRPMDRTQFGKLISGKGIWESYAVSKDGSTYVAKDPDPDGRRGVKSKFVPILEIENRILREIDSGRPVIYSTLEHITLIYGYELEAKSGRVKTYKIKDSYPDYFYDADRDALLRNLLQITVFEPTR